MEGMSTETLSWLDMHPDWDPRVPAWPRPSSATRSSRTAPGHGVVKLRRIASGRGHPD